MSRLGLRVPLPLAPASIQSLRFASALLSNPYDRGHDVSVIDVLCLEPIDVEPASAVFFPGQLESEIWPAVFPVFVREQIGFERVLKVF